MPQRGTTPRNAAHRGKKVILTEHLREYLPREAVVNAHGGYTNPLAAQWTSP
ncbi:MAG TPA: hypothetical protein VJX69_02690 [Terriglobales bacterium]|nr:hypothetical protein [Terriglobales bacterium]